MYGVSETQNFDTGKESVVIRNYLDGIKGGVALDTSDFTEEFIQCGHVIIKNSTDGTYKPLPVKNGVYEALPAGYEYVGICVTTAPVDEALVGVVTAGEVNDVAVPFSVDGILADLKTAIPTLRWAHD